MPKVFVVAVLVGVAAACSSSPTNVASGGDGAEPVAVPPAAVVPAGAPGAAATVSGRVPPASGGFPSIVILEPQGERSLPAQTDVPSMDQVQQTFIPPVLMVRTGQPVEFRNSDDVLHNVRVREDATHSPAFNVAIPTGEKYTFTFERDGFYDVGCDIHPGMSAQIVASASPYTAVADEDGGFAIASVPPGAYKAIVYAGAEKIERELTVQPNATTFNVP